MIIPVRCLSCGKPLGGLWNEFRQRIENGEDAKDVLDKMGIDRYCCRTLFLTHRDVLKNVARFKI